MRQGTMLIATSDFRMKKPGSRAVTVRTGDRFMVTSPEHKNKENTIIGREKTAQINQGYLMDNTTIARLFSEDQS